MFNIYNSYDQIPNTILSQLDEANVFFSREYYNYSLAEGNKIIYLATDGFIIPYAIRKKHIFSYGTYISEPFCLNYEYNSTENRKEFVNSVQRYIKEKKIADWQFCVGAHTMFDVYPDTSRRIGFGNLVINLENDIETLFANMTSKHRNMIRRAEKDGVVFKIGGIELLDDYCCLDEQTWERSNKPAVNRKIYENKLKYMPTSTFIAISYFDGIPQSGIFAYYNKQIMYYMYGASADRPYIGANNFLHWEVMKEMKSRGVKKYSFVGFRIDVEQDSKLAGIQHFKKGFGGELVKGYLFKENFSALKTKMVDILFRLRYKTKVDDVIEQEISKWQDINN